MRGRKGLLQCPRCDTTMRPSVARFCRGCQVYLCPACSRKKRCPSQDATHRVRTSRLPMAVMMGALWAVLVMPIGAFGYWVEQGDLPYAELPLTAVGDLVPGTTAKVFGTMESSADPVIYWTGSSRSGYWIVNAFNVTDATGSIRIDVSDIDGEDSSRIVQSGIHDREWWPGDSVSVVGSVRDDGTGTLSLLAERLARTPTSFYRPTGVPFLFLGSGVVSAGIAAVSFWNGSRVRREHAVRSTTYPYRLTDWRVCMNCGDRLSSGEPHCPACGSSSIQDPIRNPPFERLPTLDLGRRFGALPLSERAATIVFTLVLPLPLVLFAVWLALQPGFSFETGWFFIIFLAIIFPAVFGVTFVARKRVVLTPQAVEERSFKGGTRVLSREVDRAMTVRMGARVVHMLLNRGGLWVGFGPGLTAENLEATTRWVRQFAELAGIPYREANSLPEGMVMLSRDS